MVHHIPSHKSYTSLIKVHMSEVLKRLHPQVLSRGVNQRSEWMNEWVNDGYHGAYPAHVPESRHWYLLGTQSPGGQVWPVRGLLGNRKHTQIGNVKSSIQGLFINVWGRCRENTRKSETPGARLEAATGKSDNRSQWGRPSTGDWELQPVQGNRTGRELGS